MKKFLFILPIVLLFACKKEQAKPTGVTGPSSILIFFKNSTGLDLLNPATPNALNPLQIQLLDVNDAGQKTVYLKPLLDAPKGFRLIQDDAGVNYMSLTYSGGLRTGNKITRYLKFDNGSEDKITFEVMIGTEIIGNIWVNDILVPRNLDKNTTGLIEIVK